jgi:hypothetical protein
LRVRGFAGTGITFSYPREKTRRIENQTRTRTHGYKLTPKPTPYRVFTRGHAGKMCPLPSLCTGQCPVRQASLGEQATLETRRRRTTIIHRTVWWCTGLSGESSAANSSLSGKVQRRTAKIHRTVRWCTGLSGVPTVDWATVGRAIHGRRVARANGRQEAPDCPVCTGLSGVHRTVFGAPTAVNLQRSTAPK